MKSTSKELEAVLKELTERSKRRVQVQEWLILLQITLLLIYVWKISQ